jgi:hypothetical protein
MAIQDDILSMFRRIGDAGDMATRRSEAGMAILDQLTPMERMQLSSMYNPEQFSSLEEAMTFNPLIGSKALDLYQSRVGTGVETKPEQATETLVPGVDQLEMPSGGLSSLIDTAPPTRGTPAPRIPVDITELESIKTPIQTGGYYGEFAGTPGTGVGLNPVSDGRIPGKEILYEGYTPLSEPEAAALVSTVAVGGPELLAVAAIKYLGMAAPQAARMVANPATREQLRRGLTSMAEKAMGGTKQARDMTASARAAQLSKPQQQFGSSGADRAKEAARDFRTGFPGTGIYNAGGPIRRMGGGTMRDEILDRYNRMY